MKHAPAATTPLESEKPIDTRVPSLHERVLFALVEERAPATFARLCERTGAPASALANLVTNMAAIGMLTRRWPGGRRFSEAVLYDVRPDLRERVLSMCPLPEVEARRGCYRTPRTPKT